MLLSRSSQGQVHASSCVVGKTTVKQYIVSTVQFTIRPVDMKLQSREWPKNSQRKRGSWRQGLIEHATAPKQTAAKTECFRNQPGYTRQQNHPAHDPVWIAQTVMQKRKFLNLWIKLCDYHNRIIPEAECCKWPCNHVTRRVQHHPGDQASPCSAGLHFGSGGCWLNKSST